MAKGTCSVDGCEKRVLGAGLCSMHYSRLRRHGSLGDPNAPVACRECGDADGSPRTGLCHRCYRRAYMQARRADPVGRQRELDWRAERRDVINAQSRANYYANLERRRDQSRENARRYRERHPERSRATNKRTKAKYGRRYKGVRRARENSGHVPDAVMAELQRKRKCALCGVYLTRKPGPRQINVDHIVPLNAGGTHTPENLRAVCRTCNFRRPRDGRDVAHAQLPLLL